VRILFVISIYFFSIDRSWSPHHRGCAIVKILCLLGIWLRSEVAEQSMWHALWLSVSVEFVWTTDMVN
jgi:hypothetical protein